MHKSNRQPTDEFQLPNTKKLYIRTKEQINITTTHKIDKINSIHLPKYQYRVAIGSETKNPKSDDINHLII